ncbi:MAG TPA: Hsp20/alpha crystallin family protein [Nitrososphaera sp.]|nr:Hsp20/alpha crystallin family protein [Nitrososphaera sp.]
MTKSGKIAKREDRQLGYLDDIFENFRREMESAMRPWHSGFRFPSLFDGETRVPLCDMVDRGDRYELQVEVPGIEKDKINIKATGNSIEISAEKSEKTEEKRKDYVYSERSHRSFYRKIPVPKEIVPSKIDARMNNGMLVVKLPKKNPAKSKEETTKVEVK